MVHLAIVMNQITSVSSVGTCLNMLQTQVSSWAHITRKCTRKHVACVRTCRPDAKHSRLFSKTSLQTQASASAAINHMEAWCWGQHTPCPRLPPLLYWINHNILLLLLPNAPLSMTLMKTPPMPSSPLVFIHSSLLTPSLPPMSPIDILAAADILGAETWHTQPVFHLYLIAFLGFQWLPDWSKGWERKKSTQQQEATA